jgi:hypothetical protein
MSQLKTFLILTGISIGISILLYHGCFRWFKIRYMPSLSTETYSKLKRSGDRRIVISIKTDNLVSIKPMIASILDQTSRVDQIQINYNGDDKIRLEDVGMVYKTKTKFLDTFLREKDDQTIILFLNDRCIYGKDFIHDIIEQYYTSKTGIVSDNCICLQESYLSKDTISQIVSNKEPSISISNMDKLNYTENYSY